MENENQDVLEVQETLEEVQQPEVDVEELRKKAEVSSQNYERAKKAEQKAKELELELEKVKGNNKEVSSTLPQKDLIYIAKADIDEQDIGDIVDYANLKKISVKEAHEFYKPILKERAEFRKSASAAHTGGSGRVNKVNPEKILADASSGKIPETDAEIEALAEARMGQKLAKLKS